MRRFLPFLTLLMVLSIVGESQAQYRGRWYAGRTYGYGRAGGWGWNPYGAYGGGYSPVQGAYEGMADLVRARGEAYESTTRGMINYEDARSKYIDNKLKWTQTYWERKRLGEAELEKDHQADLAAWRKYRAAKEPGTPPRLSPSELDPTTGKINWPDSLMKPAFNEQRQQMENLVVLRAHTRTPTGTSEAIRQLARAMQATVKDNIKSFSANEYLEARKFLDSLAFEGQYDVT